MGALPVFEAVLKSARPDDVLIGIEKIAQGGNNRAYRLQTNHGSYLAKQYFNHADDKRDRLGTEFSFSNYANRVAPCMVPAPVARSDEERIAVYEFIDGKPFAPGDVGVNEVNIAANFFTALNQNRDSIEAAALPLASEAAFSLEGHIGQIDSRLRRLSQLQREDEQDNALHGMLTELTAAWLNVVDIARKGAQDFGIDTELELHACQRCLSPSDFGFHNALRAHDGRIVFLDFEYAGWDDPARMAADFFSQIAVPVPASLFEHFLSVSFGDFPVTEEIKQRARLLRPVYKIKWCCIALAIFQPTSRARRIFSDGQQNISESKQIQLNKARRILNSLSTGKADGLH